MNRDNEMVENIAWHPYAAVQNYDNSMEHELICIYGID